MSESKFENFFEVKHAVLQHKLTQLRDRNTGNAEFRRLIHDISLIVAIEASRSLPLISHSIATPLEQISGSKLAGEPPVIVPILRAGMSMLDALLTLFPEGRVGHVGSYRDKSTKRPQRYYFNMPPNSQASHCFLCDPMLATGGSAVDAVEQLKEFGIKHITFLCIIPCPEGVTRLLDAHPDVVIYAAAMDRELNENSSILPGLGDAGDRFYAT